MLMIPLSCQVLNAGSVFEGLKVWFLRSGEWTEGLSVIVMSSLAVDSRFEAEVVELFHDVAVR